MANRAWANLLAAVVVAAVALTSCVGIGAVEEGSVTAEAQRRGGGVTTGLVDDAIAAVSDETGVDPLVVHAITAELAAVTIVVPAGGAGGAEQWRYGTSGLYGGRGLDGPTVVAAPGTEPFAAPAGAVAVDEAVATARGAAAPGAWIDTVTVARPPDGTDPLITLAVRAGALPATVVTDLDGALTPEGLR